jgi:hypothetical protein
MAVVVLLKFQVVPAMWNAAFYGDFDVRAVPWFKDRIFIQAIICNKVRSGWTTYFVWRVFFFVEGVVRNNCSKPCRAIKE